ncbi:MAG: aminotransferase class I/II-fold pyridoxal phosphate-dependent enzyme [Deltaproteobacteria bacterium]|nr:aminotransferase class I/II-fold pyridoxal phosphate-dependent enzyme [Deltaproteobacteria bacterium]
MASINPQAASLNETIASANPNVLPMLSTKGKNIFFPHKGILGQSAEAKNKKINATIGIALENDGTPMRLNSVASQFNVSPADALTYAPSPGKPSLRDVWKEMIFKKNPSLGSSPISRPIVASALTHALSICGYLFLDENDTVISPDLYWGNYRLMFEHAYGARIDTYTTFKAGGFNIDGLKEKLGGPVGKKIVVLNFPNNPTGYTPTTTEIDSVVDVLVDAAERGNNVIALIDDAYFGLVYEKGIYTESIFARLAQAHEKILAVKVDGATKEDYVWGFRIGFITYAIKGANSDLYKALEDKTGGAIRGNVSNSPHLSQSIMQAAYNSPTYEAEKKEKFDILKARYDKIKEILAAKAEYRELFEALPFNSGYFMCLDLKGSDPEAVRQVLLKDYSTGVIVAAGVMRLAFSATPLDLLDELFENIYHAAKKVKQG